MVEDAIVREGTTESAFAKDSRVSVRNGMESVSVLLRYVALITNDLHLAEFRAKILEAAPEVDVWLERVLFAATLDDVFAPLQ